MNREIQSFPLSKLSISKLLKAGYSSVSSLEGVDDGVLEKNTGLTKDECTEILWIVAGSQSEVYGHSAKNLLMNKRSSSGIVTFCQKIDNMLGEGLQTGKVTEFCGMPGTGKTQICLQLCIDATIPECFGGVQGTAVYIDTEGSFVAERLSQIAQATINHCRLIANSTNDPDMLEQLTTYDLNFILRYISYFRAHSVTDLISLLIQLPQFIKSHHNDVKLIVIDNVAFHLRHDWSDMSSRTRVMTNIVLRLLKLASDFNLAVVLMNQMTTRVTEIESKIVPALGESWSHLSNHKIELYNKNGTLYAQLFKSSNRKCDTVPFCITSEGIRDVAIDDYPPEPSPKRQRIGEHEQQSCLT